MVNFEEGAPIPRHRSSSMRYLTKKALSHFPTDSNKPSYELFANSIAFLSCQEVQRAIALLVTPCITLIGPKPESRFNVSLLFLTTNSHVPLLETLSP